MLNVYVRNQNVILHPSCNFSNVNFILKKGLDGSTIPNFPYTTGDLSVYVEFTDSNIPQCSIYTFNIFKITSLTPLPITNNIDSDGILTINEDLNNNGNLYDDDTDLDGIPNFQDLDDDGDGVNTINEDYNRNGNYNDDDQNTNGIPDYLDSSVALSIAENIFTSFKIYPNPTSNILNIGFVNDFAEKINISIYDFTGKLVYHSFESNKTINISSLNSGIYTLKAEFNETKVIRKLVVM